MDIICIIISISPHTKSPIAWISIGGTNVIFAAVTSPTLTFALTGFGIVFISIVWSLHPKLRNLPKAEDMSPESFGLDFAEENTEQAKS